MSGRGLAVATLVLAVGMLVGSYWTITSPYLAVLLWPLLASLALRYLRVSTAENERGLRLAVAMQVGFLLALLTLHFTLPSPQPLYLNLGQWGGGHPPFGFHPVTARAGLPRPGVEGCPPYGLAKDRIPFDMGVDALLVNFASWSLLSLLFVGSIAKSTLQDVLVLMGLGSPVLVCLGAWQIVCFFD